MLNLPLYAFKDQGIEITEEESKLIIGQSATDFLPYFEAKYDFDYETYRKCRIAHYHKNILRDKPIAYVVGFIKEQSKLPLMLALTTASYMEPTKVLLKKEELGDLFEVIVAGYDCKRKKPDPLPYSMTNNRLKLLPRKCVVIEDTAIWVASAKVARAHMIAVSNKYPDEGSDADFKPEKFDDLTIKLIKSFD